MDYKFKILLFLVDSFIVRDTEAKKYYHVLKVPAVTEALKQEHTIIEFNDFSDFDFGTTKEITEAEYLSLLKGDDVDANTEV